MTKAIVIRVAYCVLFSSCVDIFFLGYLLFGYCVFSRVIN